MTVASTGMQLPVVPSKQCKEDAHQSDLEVGIRNADWKICGYTALVYLTYSTEGPRRNKFYAGEANHV